MGALGLLSFRHTGLSGVMGRSLMRRLAFLATLSVVLSGCGSYSSWIPSGLKFDFGSRSAVAEVRVETEPSGADARSSSGATCRTPCILTVPASAESAVTVSAPGYLPQTVPVRPRPPDDPRPSEGLALPGPEVTPNPILVQLEPAPPPAPVKKKQAKRPKRPAAAPPSPQAAEPVGAASAWPTAQPAPAWPSR